MSAEINLHQLVSLLNGKSLIPQILSVFSMILAYQRFAVPHPNTASQDILWPVFKYSDLLRDKSLHGFA